MKKIILLIFLSVVIISCETIENMESSLEVINKISIQEQCSLSGTTTLTDKKTIMSVKFNCEVSDITFYSKVLYLIREEHKKQNIKVDNYISINKNGETMMEIGDHQFDIIKNKAIISEKAMEELESKSYSKFLNHLAPTTRDGKDSLIIEALKLYQVPETIIFGGCILEEKYIDGKTGKFITTFYRDKDYGTIAFTFKFNDTDDKIYGLNF